PGLVATLTGLPQREVASAARDALITAFATGNDFVVLPLLTERTKEILEKHQMDDDEDTDAIVDVVVPVSHNFPHTAKILSLSFIVFAGWFTGNELGPADYPALGGAGVVSTFGSVNLAIPFLLDLFHLPSDLFNLFVATSVVNARFGTLLAAMHGFCLALLVTAALTGRLVFSWVRILRFGLVTLAVVGVTVVAVRTTLNVLVDTDYDRGAVFDQFPLAQQGVDSVRAFRPGESAPERELPQGPRIEAILTEDTLRACYVRPTLPFAYFDTDGAFVGFDVEMAYSLARGLGTSIEFVQAPDGEGREPRIGEALDRGDCDLVLGTAISMDQAKWLDYSKPYLDLTMALLVPDHRRGAFVKRKQIERMQGLRLGVGPNTYYQRRVRTLLPDAELVVLDQYLEVMDGSRTDVHAIVHVAEIASAYSLLYPNWSAVVPDPPFQKVPVAYGLPDGETGWRNYVDSWLDLKKRDGTIDLLYDHWVLGRGAEPQRPRWSIVRDVLHWVD
ncbi:MAG: transporter substrate-binding domain-containing protein, partial [Deltaproteobacteria bacterium]|nr:transporter substrate-binding domain-containing protein [Deltaproteobacteria bacterium]